MRYADERDLALRTGPGTVIVNGVEMLAFVGCDYLGLSFEPAVNETVARARREHGLSVAASRATTGTSPVHRRAEHALAMYLGCERALLLSSGTLANMAACEGLAAMGIGTVWVDPDAHPSIGLSTRAAGMTETPANEAALWCVDGTNPGIGFVNNIKSMTARLDGRWLLVDDCHGIGVVGPTGRGACESVIDRERLILTGTGAKALGVGGGFVAGIDEAIAAIECSSMAYICTTAVDIGIAAGITAVLSRLSGDGAILARLRTLHDRFRTGLASLGVKPHSGEHPVHVLSFDSPSHAASVSAGLHDMGVYAPVVSYPGQPGGSGIRISLNAGLSDSQVDRYLGSLASVLTRGGAAR